MSLEFESRPKYNDDHAVCCCDSKAVPTKGDIDFKTDRGYTQTKTMFWCKRCGLALTFVQMDRFGDTWDEIMGRQKRINEAYDRKRKAAFEEEGLEDPLA